MEKYILCMPTIEALEGKKRKYKIKVYDKWRTLSMSGNIKKWWLWMSCIFEMHSTIFRDQLSWDLLFSVKWLFKENKIKQPEQN